MLHFHLPIMEMGLLYGFSQSFPSHPKPKEQKEPEYAMQWGQLP
jgi:hypothetical protein